MTTTRSQATLYVVGGVFASLAITATMMLIFVIATAHSHNDLITIMFLLCAAGILAAAACIFIDLGRNNERRMI